MNFLLNEIDLIYKKVKLNDEFKRMCQSISSLKEIKDLISSSNFKQIPEEDIQNELFSKIFTKDLTYIKNLLSWQNNSMEVHFSLIRIYLNFFQKSPHPKNSNIDGKTMIYNLFRCYVTTFEGNKDNLFKEENK